MIALIQRVKKANVIVNSNEVASISKGMLVFIGVEKKDNREIASQMFLKIKNIRIFADEQNKMNLNIEQAKGEILIVPQFTLAATTKKGNRPGFDPVAPHELANNLFNQIVDLFKEQTNIKVETGIFQADMDVGLINDGPITFYLKK